MAISPELAKIPRIARSYFRAGIAAELIKGILTGESGRNMVEDAGRLLNELKKDCQLNLVGLENIPREHGALIIFNHPNSDVLMPAFLELVTGIYGNSGQQLRLAMATEIPMISSYNEKTALPGSIWLLTRFHNLYSNNIISIPTVESRKDFLAGRAVALRKMMRTVKEGNILMVSPEGHTEIDNVISPKETFHAGSGELSVWAAKNGIPTIPLSIWEESGTIEMRLGEPMFPGSTDPAEAAVEAMYAVAMNLPEEFRGPFP